jgi:hypothetical protein
VRHGIIPNVLAWVRITLKGDPDGEGSGDPGIDLPLSIIPMHGISISVDVSPARISRRDAKDAKKRREEIEFG